MTAAIAESKPAVPGVPVAPPPMSERELAEVIGAFNDVTTKLHAAHETLRAEVVRLKDELRVANEQLERSRRLAALGEMAAGIAHEVRNPLASIRLYARMLETDLADRPAQQDTAERIGSAVRGLDAVVLDVLAFAKEMRIRPEPIDVRTLIDRAIDESLADDPAAIQGRAGSQVRPAIRVLRPAWHSPADDDLICDGHLAHRALVNIIRNAIQAMRDDPACAEPTLTISAEPRSCPVGEPDARSSLAITILDNGPGIPPEVLSRIFNPFFTTRATGTGLGLAIVHRIMDAHGGRVVVRPASATVDSAEGPRRGTLVELLFPHDHAHKWPMDAPGRAGESTPALAG